VVMRVVGSLPGPSQPIPALPGPGRVPLAPPPPMRANPLPLYLILFPAQQPPPTPLPPLFHLLCPRCDPVDGCRDRPSPKVSPHLPLSFPSSPFSSLSWPRPGALAAPCRAPWPRLAARPGRAPGHAPRPRA
jgi:hypothetical protein